MHVDDQPSRASSPDYAPESTGEVVRERADAPSAIREESTPIPSGKSEAQIPKASNSSKSGTGIALLRMLDVSALDLAKSEGQCCFARNIQFELGYCDLS